MNANAKIVSCKTSATCLEGQCRGSTGLPSTCLNRKNYVNAAKGKAKCIVCERH